MAAGDTIVERAIQDLVTTLEGISVANGYNHDVKSVRRCEDMITSSTFPLLVVTELGVDNSRVINPYVFAQVNLSISIYDDAPGQDGKWVTPLKLLVSDVEHAIRTTPYRGGLAENTVPQRHQIFDAARDASVVSAEVLVNIKTRFLYTNATAYSGAV